MKVFNTLKIHLFLASFRKACPVSDIICCIKIVLLRSFTVVEARSLAKAVANGCVSVGLGQAGPVRSARGEHLATPQRKARAGPQRRSSERASRGPRGGAETSQHDGVGCHEGEAPISELVFATRCVV